jgi:hypothetical protein
MNIYEKILFVCGTFDSGEGKPSGFMREIVKGFTSPVRFVNGGHITTLRNLASNARLYQTIIWAPNVSNDEEKLLPLLKKKNPQLVLVSSKRNFGEYSFNEIVGRSLSSRSQLLIEIVKCSDGLLQCRLVDVLGNASHWHKNNLREFGQLLSERLSAITEMVRIPSHSLGPVEEKVVVEEKFLGAIKNYAERFHELIHGPDFENPRFLGNASFRCTKGGFPSFRKKGNIYVSRRNVDKRSIGSEDFVPVRLSASDTSICYWGDNKPSVDTPIQSCLYQHFEHIRFMLHAHVYLEHAPFTEKYVPCGDLREFTEIVKVLPNKEATNFFINLRGHGCIVASNCLDDLVNLNFISRPKPEYNHFLAAVGQENINKV